MKQLKDTYPATISIGIMASYKVGHGAASFESRLDQFDKKITREIRRRMNAVKWHAKQNDDNDIYAVQFHCRG